MLVLVVLWAVGEVAALQFAQSRIERAAMRRSQGAATVEANVDSFPVVTRVVLTGEVPRITVTLDRVARNTVTFSTVRFSVTGAGINRAAALRGEVEVTDIDRGRVTAVLPADVITEVLGAAADRDAVDVEAGDGELVLTAAGAGAASIPLPGDLVPCGPDTEIDGDRIVLRCTFQRVPMVLARQVGS